MELNEKHRWDLESDSELYPQRVPTLNKYPPILAAIILLLVAALGNFGITALVTQFTSFNGTAEHVCSILAGLLIAQPCLLGIWTAMAPLNWLSRMTIGSTALALLTLIYILAMHIFTPVGDGIQGELVLTFLGIAFSTFAAVGTSIGIIRITRKFQISRISKQNDSAVVGQFKIGQLMIVTTLLAVATALGKLLLPLLSFRADGPPWGEIIFFIGCFFAITVFLCWLTTAVVFASKGRLIAIVGLLASLACGPPVVVILLRSTIPTFNYGGNQGLFEMCVNTFLYCISLVFTLIVVQGIYFGLGFRFRSTR